MSEVFEIREFLDQNNRPIKSEVIDVFGEYDSLRKVLQENKEKVSDKDAVNLDDNGYDKEEDDNVTRLQNEKVKKNQFIETLCERLNPDSIESRPKGDEERMLVRELEKFSRMSLDKPITDQEVLREDLSFFDDLEKLEYEEDRRAAAIRIRQREKQLEEEYALAAAAATVANNRKKNMEMKKSVPSSSSSTSSSSGWNKGFLSSSSSSSSTSSTAVTTSNSIFQTSPLAQPLSTIVEEEIITTASSSSSVSTEIFSDSTATSNTKTQVASVESLPTPAAGSVPVQVMKPKQAAVAKPRPFSDKVIERFP